MIEKFQQLSQRERLFVIGGGLMVILVLLYIAILLPYQNALERLDNQIAARSRQLEEVRALRLDYLQRQRELTQVERRLDNRRDFSALTFIENLAVSSAGRERLVSMRPQAPVVGNRLTTEAVEIKLERVTLREVVELLRGIEGAKTPMQVRSLQLKQRFDDRSRLDASMTIAALRRNA
ncbi:MAG: type II secretion system protein GspM [Desulfuromonadales bacterium]|nr:type II secretion system protein GspM [Desulfuromonadales bacterium]